MIALALTGLGLLFVHLYRKSSIASRSLPPGPSPLPLIGNLPHLPKDRPWIAYRALSERYGELR